MKAKKVELKLVEVHGKEVLFTTTLVIAFYTERTHEAVIKLVRKFLDDLQEVGRVRFEIRPFETKGGIQEQEIALLDDYAAVLLLTHMRSIGVVREFKKRLVQEFKRMRKMLADPDRTAALKYKRDTARPMTDCLQYIRELAGKKTDGVPHCLNEMLFCNRALTGEWKELDEVQLDAYDNRLLGKIRERNTILIALHPKQADRRQLLDDFVAEYRVKHPKPQLSLVINPMQPPLLKS